MTQNVPTDRVLSTLNVDGTRRWMQPKLSPGRFLNRRRVVAYALIALFVLLPRIRIGGRPGFLIDLISREIVIGGTVFRPSDGIILAFLGISVAITVFLVTAMWGRVWCGWGCPQSIYLEHVYRPIERLFEGSRGQRASVPRKVGKWIAYSAVSFALANVFLAYFVGTDRLEHWVFQSPTEHVGGFMLVMGVSALMLFDFGYFREQTCIVACPYGRLQSVMLDKQSLIIGYDPKRGEPRAKAKKKLPVVQNAGDCVDCGACVTTCPTGIDIRDGLQMECIGCAQCIDACDNVMDKLGRKRGLIRYTSKDELAGVPRKVLRMRTIVYPIVLLIAVTGTIYTITHRGDTEVWIERIQGPSFVELPDGKVSAQARIKLENKTDAERRYNLYLTESPNASLRSQPVWTLAPHKSVVIPLFIDVPRDSFHDGKRKVYLRIHETGGIERVLTLILLGPANDHEEHEHENHEGEHK
jgi:cytochrome c oxidase accessory protein FixG